MKHLQDRPQPWLSAAACLGTGPARFYPEPDTDPHADKVEAAAKAVCAGCEVRDQCLEYALARREQHGVWGGLNVRERRRVLRERRDQDPPAARVCGVEGCDRKAERYGWCQTHYVRWRRTGNPGPTPVAPRRPNGTGPGACSLDGCDRPVDARGWCQLHYWRWRRTGNPGAPGAATATA